jgi:iron complex outermembrane receptor protein
LVPGPIPYLEVAGTIANGLYGETYGGELDATWQATDWWRLHLGYTWLRMHLHTRSDSADIGNEDWIEGIDPRNQVYLRSSLDLPANVAFDTTFRYVDMSASLNVPSYLVMDLRLAWRPVEQLELSVVGQNLLDDGHAEARGSTVEHSVYGKLTWEF